MESVRLQGEYFQTNGKLYNTSPPGPIKVHELKHADYGEGFRQGTLGEQLTLVNQAFSNRQTTGADKIIKIIENHWVSGNTLIYGGVNDLIFAIDNPEFKGNRAILDEEKLIEILDDKETLGNVRFSKNKLVRAMPRLKARKGEKSIEEVLGSEYPLFLTGNEDSPGEIRDILISLKKPCYFWIPEKKAISFPGLDIFENFSFGGDKWGESGEKRYSFGLKP